jgi:hypothetical protein
LSAYDDFTDLDDRGLVGIVWDVCHDLFGMRPETSLERLDRVAEDMTHSDICRRSAGCSARKALVHRIELAEWAIAVSAVGSELRSKAPPAVLRRRRNILIAAEEIVGIVAILEPLQAGKILSVG